MWSSPQKGLLAVLGYAPLPRMREGEGWVVNAMVARHSAVRS